MVVVEELIVLKGKGEKRYHSSNGNGKANIKNTRWKTPKKSTPQHYNITTPQHYNTLTPKHLNNLTSQQTYNKTLTGHSRD